jgi:hypothetical protein
MASDSSSLDRRFICRECQRPRLRAVALLTDPIQRAKLMASPLCVDHHRPDPDTLSPEARAYRDESEETAF